MTWDLELAYREHLTASDVAVLGELRDRPLTAVLSSPEVERTVFGPDAMTDPLRTVSPFLTFAVAVHRTAERLAGATYVEEWIGPRRRVPVFAVEPLRQLLADPRRRFFFVELLASYTRVVSGSTWTATRRGWRRRRFSELDPVQLAELLATAPPAELPGVLRRLGDLALFLTGVFPDHTATTSLGRPSAETALAPLGRRRAEAGRAGLARRVPAPRAARRPLVRAGSAALGRPDRVGGRAGRHRPPVHGRPPDPQRRHRHLPVSTARPVVRAPRGVTPDRGPPRRASSAKALLLTALGEFVLPAGGSVWTSTVVRGLAVRGVEERNARQALARLADQGVVRPERLGRRTRWHLTEGGSRLLTVGAERIYGFGAGEDRWDGRWLVVFCSVPEEQRTKRHQLRTQLEFAGFGFLAPGLAISPHPDREDAANAVLKGLDLVPGAVVLRAETGALVADDELLHRAWDLDGLAAEYEAFVAAFESRRPAGDEDRFGALVDLVHAWRHFPFVDPEIPARLLPAAWIGGRAKRLFDARHDAWSPAARRWYDEAEGAAG